MLDRRDTSIQITIEENVVWVNIDGICAVRVHNPTVVEVLENGRDLFTFQRDNSNDTPQ